mgnify:CR=1 FL=1
MISTSHQLNFLNQPKVLIFVAIKLHDSCMVSMTDKQIYKSVLSLIKEVGSFQLTQKFLSCFFKNFEFCKDTEILLVDEVKTSRSNWRKTKIHRSIHEHAAMLIGKRPGELVTADNIIF